MYLEGMARALNTTVAELYREEGAPSGKGFGQRRRKRAQFRSGCQISEKDAISVKKIRAAIHNVTKKPTSNEDRLF